MKEMGEFFHTLQCGVEKKDRAAQTETDTTTGQIQKFQISIQNLCVYIILNACI